MKFKKDTDYEKISKNYHFYYNQNPINSIFSLRLEWGIGKYENNSLSLASGFGAMIGNEQYSFNEFKEELQKIGATVDFFSTMNHTGINIKGFDKHFKKTIELAGSFLSSMKIRKEDKKKLKKLIQGSVIERKFETTETSAKSDAIKQYAIWGEKSDYLTRPTVNEVKKMDGDFLIDQTFFL